MPSVRGRKGPSTQAPQKNSVEILRLAALEGVPWLVHGFSTRQHGISQAYGGQSLNLGYSTHDTHVAVDRNRELFLRAMDGTAGGRQWKLVTVRQIHSSTIHNVKKPTAGLTGDGLITDQPNLLLGIKTADCFPILLADVRRRAVGAFHAGWRGTVARIVEKGMGEMQCCFRSHPEDIRAAIGPGIHGCCYEVGEEVREQFESQFAYANELFQEVANGDEVRRKYPLLFMNMRAPGHGEPARRLHLDLVEANRRQLLNAGVPAENISVSGLCTSCRTDLLFSHRKEKGVTGRMLAVAGIRRKG